MAGGRIWLIGKCLGVRHHNRTNYMEMVGKGAKGLIMGLQ